METSKSVSHQTLRDYAQIDLALAGSQQAYRALFKRYWKQLFFTVNKVISDKEEARDVAMEGFAKAFGNLHQFRKDYSFITWLYRVAINHSLDHLRRKRLPTTPLSTLPEEANDYFPWDNGPNWQGNNPEEQIIRRQKTMAVERHLYALPPVLQEVARMRFVEAYSYEEIAKSLHLPLGTVKARVHRSRYRLQASLLPLRNHL